MSNIRNIPESKPIYPDKKMDNQYMRQSYSDDEIPEMMRRLNALYTEPFQWKSKRAQREHEDLFGRKIQRGERYFRLRMGGSYTNDLKLSYNSMERILFALFYPNPHLVNWADKLIDERQKKVIEIINELRK